MSNPVVSVQGNGKKLIMYGILDIIMAVVLPIIIYSKVEEGKIEENLETAITVLSYLLIFTGTFTISIGIQYSRTRIYAFEDHIQGQGLVRFNLVSFSLRYDKVSSVTVNKDKLFINNSGMVYKIGVPSSYAVKIVNYINSRM